MKKIANTIILILYSVSLSGCDQIYRMLHKEGAEEKEIVGDILPLEKNPTIEEVQILLSIYGYNPGKADGVLGRRTRDAIERFQKDNELTPSRFVDQSTWKKLKTFVDNGFILKGKLNIKQLQQTLKVAGFDPGAIDGKVGPKTKEAIMAFQKKHQLKVDGKVGFKTLSALVAYFSMSP